MPERRNSFQSGDTLSFQSSRSDQESTAMIPKSSLRVLLTLCVTVLSCGAAAIAQPSAIQPVSEHPQAKVAPNYGKLPLSFEPNRGQVDSSVQFLARGSHYSVLLQPVAATLVLNREKDASAQRRPQGRPATTSAAVRMTLDGANPGAAMSPERLLPGYVNYITGDNAHSHTGIPTYAAARATGVYPGIDLIYYGTERQLEYDFVVAPQSDPGLIHLSIAGAHPVIEPNGELRLELAAGKRDNDFVFRKPVLYQKIDGKQQTVEGSFTVARNGEVGFKVGTYDRSRELVIDPVINFGSYYGGNGEDEINGSALNASNELYAVGQTLSAVLPSASGEFEAGGNGGVGGHDAFVAKFSADGSTVLWTTFLEGSGDDFASGVAVNSSDQAYVVGNTYSCLNPGEFNNTPSNAVRFPFTSDAIQPLCNPGYNQPETGESDGGNSDAFLVKLSSDGKTELYGTPLGGSQNDYASSIVLDATGRPYIVGETNSTQYYKCATIGPHCNDVPSYPVDNHGNADIGPSNYPTTANAFYSNVAESIQYATTDPNSGNTGGPQDEQAFITILSADLHSFVYSSLIGGGIIGGCGNGNCNTNGIAVAVNAAGQAFIGGNTSSAHWPTTSGAFAATCSNAGNANSQCPMTGWLAGFDPSKSGAASLLFMTYMNGSSAGLDPGGNPLYPGGDVYGLAVDSQGNVVVTGDTNADNFPTTAGTLQPACVQFGDGNGNSKRCASAYITKLSPTGATVWSTYFGPTTQTGNGAFVVGNGVALDASDNVYVVGSSNLATLPLVNPITSNQPQNDDAFVLELSPAGSAELMGTFLGANGNLTVDNNSLHLDSNLDAYISGSQSYCTNCTITFPTTPGAFATTGLGGSADGWVLKLITQKQTSSTALQITPTAGAPGTSISFTVTVTGLPAFATPTGTVALTSGSTTLGTIILVRGTGTFTTTSLTAGTYSVIATYSGDVVYAASSTTAQTVSVQNTPTVTLSVTPSATTIGTAVALKATVTSSAGTPTGTVYFLDGSTTLGSAVLSGGTAAYSATALAAGTHSITAYYGGDNNFVAFTSSAQTVTINLITPAVALTATPASAQVGTAIALGATVTGTGGTPTGTVKFLDGTTTLVTLNLSGGVASYSATSLTAGTHTITASYSGDGNFSALVSSPQTVTISAIPPSITAALNPTVLTITRGATGSSTLTIVPVNGFAGTLSFACGSLPSSASCGFSPASLTFASASNASQSTVLTVSTNASIVGKLHPLPFGPNGRNHPGITFAVLLILPLAFTRRGRRLLPRYGGISMVLCLSALVGLGVLCGCGGGSGTPAAAATTPAGTYSIGITVSGAPTGTPALNLQINVQ
jgi:hypothetical protein